MGSGALAIPFDKYHGRWKIDKEVSYIWWKPFIQYIIRHQLTFLDKQQLEFLIDNGNFFLDIPIGYGLGSSGALTAAIYDFARLDEVSDLVELQRRLGLIESFFHGKSSGYDPLISFIDKGVQKSPSGETSYWSPGHSMDFNCYLLDSGTPRVGKELIAKFQKYSKEEKVRFDRIVALNNEIIHSLEQEVDAKQLFQVLNQLSIEQFDKMDFLILSNVQEVWRSTLESDDIAVKICGAGGGGYYLVFSKETISTLGGFSLVPVF